MKNVFAAATAAYLMATAAASPVSKESEAPVAKNLLGYDESLKQLFRSTDKAPEVRYLTEADGVFNATATFAPAKVLNEKERAEVSKRYINGVDDRYQYTDSSYPFIATGKLYWDSGVFCSGALIGPRHVLTAKHCIADGAGYFAPNFDNGEPFGRGAVTHIVSSGWDWGSGCGWKGDWAILVLDNRLGDQLGYFGAKYPDPNLQDQPIFDHIGYPGDRDGGNRPYRMPGNTVQSFREWDCDATGPFYTDTDCAGGQSGGPHWENTADGAMIWGTLAVTIASGEEAWAGWGSGNEMIDSILRTRADFP